MTELTRKQQKHHPTKPCAACGKTRRVQCRGLCSSCYIAAREAEKPGYIRERKEYQKEWVKKNTRYIDPLDAIKILTRFFEAHNVNIDDLCNYISLSRALHTREGADPHKPDRTHRHWAKAWKRRKAKCHAS